MPLYDYRCSHCDKTQERLVGLEERDKQECECGQHLERQMSAHSKHSNWTNWQVGLAVDRKVR